MAAQIFNLDDFRIKEEPKKGFSILIKDSENDLDIRLVFIEDIETFKERTNNAIIIQDDSHPYSIMFYKNFDSLTNADIENITDKRMLAISLIKKTEDFSVILSLCNEIVDHINILKENGRSYLYSDRIRQSLQLTKQIFKYWFPDKEHILINL